MKPYSIGDIKFSAGLSLQLSAWKDELEEI